MRVFSGPCCGRWVLVLASSVLLLFTGVTWSQQISAEESSFEAARAQTDPAVRRSRLEHFLQQFPSGSRSSLAQDLLLQTYLASFPEQTESIHTLASAMVLAAHTGFDRWTEQARLADMLASAGENGADLQDARHWAEDAVASLTEESYRREMVAAQIRYKLPKIPQKQMHAQFVEYRASFLATLAHVDLRDGKPEAASGLLAEAFRLQPLSGQVNALRGQLALAEGNRAAALDSLERADALGSLQQPWRDREAKLFEELQHGDATALETRVDEVYRSLFPPLFTLPKRQLPAGGHTVLLELFTGSGCAPCAGPDLALESLLGSYSRKDLVLLAYDEHIPRPDPLTTPDSAARAATYRVANTPAAFLDGQSLDVLGASRQDVENIVLGFADQVEDEATLPSGLLLTLDATWGPTGAITARPTVSEVALPGSPAAEKTGALSRSELARAVLHVALVQDNIRYAGENGVRFHRMVVRAMSEAPVTRYLSPDAKGSPFVFDPGSLDRELTAYLSDYEAHNDRFGTVHFATKSFPIKQGDLAVVAWVQDPVTHQVFQAAFAALPRR